MHISVNKPLFAWDALEDSPSLKSLRTLIGAIPDQALLAGLRAARGRGRNDHSVETMWGVVVLTVALRKQGFNDCLDELRRNPALALLIGVEREEDVPDAWNVSRFLETLGSEPHLSELRRVFSEMAALLGTHVPDLGQHLAGDSSALSARRRQGEGRQDEDAQGLPQPSGGKKEYTDDEGRVTQVYEWFGYKFHLLVDVRHEVALAYRVTSATTADSTQIAPLLDDARHVLPEGRIETLAYDKAADDEKTHALLDDAGITPLIQNRALWKQEHERRLPGHDGSSNIVYDEAGTVHCYNTESTPPVRQAMAFIGHEPSRRTLKYRCPAKHQGWECPMSKVCNAGKSYGLTVRVPRDVDLRRFPPLPRATKKFEALYKGRTAVERVNGRMKVFWGADDGNITGARRFHAFLGVVMVVHLAFATLLAVTPRREGTLGRMRLSPIAAALSEKLPTTGA